FNPSLVRRSSRSFAYAFSSSIIATTSPGMSRGSVNTMSDAISSDGMATTSRFARYRLSIGGWLPVEPRGDEPPAIVVADVRDVGPVLLLVQRGVDAHVFQVLHHDLHGVDEDGGSVGREAQVAGEAVRVTRGGEQALGLGRIVLEVLRAFAELLDRE